MKSKLLYALVCAFLVFTVSWVNAAPPPPTQEPILVVGTVTFVEITKTGCFGCKLMASTVPDIQKEYDGRAKVVILDYKYEPHLARMFGARVTPTHIFYNHKGEEVLRKEGSMKKPEIRKVLDELILAKAHETSTIPVTVDPIVAPYQKK